MTAFEASFDTRAFDRQLKQLSRRDLFGSFSRALTRAQQSMRRSALAQVREDLNIKAGPVRNVVKTSRVGRGRSLAQVRIISQPAEIFDFSRTRETSRGISVQIKKGGPRKIIRSGFEATMRSGKTSYFRRRRRGGKAAGRLPIDVLYSTSVRQSLADRKKQEVILDAGRTRFVRELRREISRRLSAAR